MYFKCMMLIMFTLFLAACNGSEESDDNAVVGVWSLVKETYPEGVSFCYPTEDGNTYLKLYPNDSIYYYCKFSNSASGMTLVPISKGTYTLVYKGRGEYLYFEDDQPRPFTFVCDTIISTQQNGRVRMWHKVNTLSEDRIADIQEVLDNDTTSSNGMTNQYVISTAERHLTTINHILGHVVVLVVLLLCIAVNHLVRVRRRKERIEQQLRMIKEERASRPKQVAEALKSVEEEFLMSDYYVRLRRNIRDGVRMKKEGWTEVEHRLQAVYPQFANRIYSLCNMSDVERQVTLLVKLQVPPTEIAAVINKEVSTVSSIRSRLYYKVFGRKGGAKDWDEFIRSL